MKMGNLTKVIKVNLFNLIASLFIICITSTNCTNTKEKHIIINDNISTATQIADTIIYDVLLQSPDPDDEWINYTLKNVKTHELVDFVFEAVYEKKAEAFHYYTNEKFSIEEVKQIEEDPEFSRDKIAKVQFVEEWLLDEENMNMYKRIHSIMLGYVVKDEEGNIRGYKPTFRIYLNMED